jgi:hypothetical protein
VIVNIDNAVFAEYRQAAQLIRDALVKAGHEVPLNQLIDLLINAELVRITPEEIARHFLILAGMPEAQASVRERITSADEFLHQGENG